METIRWLIRAVARGLGLAVIATGIRVLTVPEHFAGPEVYIGMACLLIGLDLWHWGKTK